VAGEAGEEVLAHAERAAEDPCHRPRDAAGRGEPALHGRVEPRHLRWPDVPRVVVGGQAESRVLGHGAADVDGLEQVGRARQAQAVGQRHRLRRAVPAVDAGRAAVAGLRGRVGAKNASVADVNAASVAASMPWPVICMNPDGAGGLVDGRGDGVALGLRARRQERGDVDDGHVEHPATVWAVDIGSPFRPG
jgi:hypothetical protein